MMKALLLGVVLTFSTAQTFAAVTISNVRLTQGELGAVRPTSKFIPGDVCFVSYEIEGFTVNADGKVTYAMTLEVLDSAGKAIYKQGPLDRNDFLPLGGSKLPARAFVKISFDQSPGAYTVRVTVVDKTSKASQVMEQKFEVAAKAFGLVEIYTSSDREGRIPAPHSAFIGQTMFLNFSIVGFDRDKAKKSQPDIEVTMTVLDKDGKPTLPKPTTLNIDSVDMADLQTTWQFFMPLNRTGAYTIVLKATDKLSKKTDEFKLTIKVSPLD